MMAVQENGLLREEFGATQVQHSAQTAESAVAAQMQAQVNARYIMAMRRPRSWLQVRSQIMDECKRPRFAETAIYQKPVGRDQFVTGFSIRFAEAVVRYVSNVSSEVTTLYDDSRKRLIRVQATDLETNVTYSQDITIEKTVERKFLRKGQQALASRANSYGDMVHLVEATEGDLMTKENAAISKALRTLVLRLLPGDIADDAREAIDKTIANEHQNEDPQVGIKKVVDAFSRLRIQPNDLCDYLGHDVAKASPAQLADLRRVYTAVQQGETTWAEVMETRKASQPEGDDADAAPAKQSRSKALAGKLKEKLAAPAPAEPTAAPESEDYQALAAAIVAKQRQDSAEE